MKLLENRSVAELDLSELIAEIWSKKYLIIILSILGGGLSLAYVMMKPVVYEQKGAFSFYTDMIQFSNDQGVAAYFSYDYIANRSLKDFNAANENINNSFSFNYDSRKKKAYVTVRGGDDISVGRDFSLYSNQISDLAKKDLGERKRIESKIMQKTFSKDINEKLLEAISEKVAINIYIQNLVNEAEVQVMSVTPLYVKPIKLSEKTRKMFIMLGALSGFVLSTLLVLLKFAFRKK